MSANDLFASKLVGCRDVHVFYVATLFNLSSMQINVLEYLSLA